MRRVIFDSSFLMAVAERPTTWLEDVTTVLGKVEPVILECGKRELLMLSHGTGRKAKLARVALKLAEGFATEPCGGAKVDDEIVSAAVARGAAVATADEELASAMKALGIQVIGLRSGRAALV